MEGSHQWIWPSTLRMFSYPQRGMNDSAWESNHVLQIPTGSFHLCLHASRLSAIVLFYINFFKNTHEWVTIQIKECQFMMRYLCTEYLNWANQGTMCVRFFYACIEKYSMFEWKFETIKNAKPKAEKLVVSSTRPVYLH